MGLTVANHYHSSAASTTPCTRSYSYFLVDAAWMYVRTYVVDVVECGEVSTVEHREFPVQQQTTLVYCLLEEITNN